MCVCVCVRTTSVLGWDDDMIERASERAAAAAVPFCLVPCFATMSCTVWWCTGLLDWTCAVVIEPYLPLYTVQSAANTFRSSIELAKSLKLGVP